MEEPDFNHFRSISWCSTLLSDPRFTITPTLSREYKASTEDSLVAETLRSPQTITHCLSLYLTPPPDDPWINEVRTLMTLGSGMNGGVNALHGGIISTLMDDVMGTLLTVNKDASGGPLSGGTVTASLEVRFLRVLSTPGTVVVGARCRRREGRKFWLEAWIEGEDGGKLASSDALWISIGRRERL